MIIYPTQCQLCFFNVKSTQALANHLYHKHEKYNHQNYYDNYIGEVGVCVVCQNRTKFISLSKGYNNCCSLSCAVTKQWIGNEERKQSNRIRLVKNPMSGGRKKGTKNKNKYPKSLKVLERYKNNPPPSWSGKKHSPETREKMSSIRIQKMASGEIKMRQSYKGKYLPKNPKKYVGDYRNIIYRSLWERQVMVFFDENPKVLRWASEELAIPYRSPVDNKIHNYFVDFYAKMETKDGSIKEYLIEVKPASQTKPPEKNKKVTKAYINEIATWGVNEAKWNAAIEYCKDRNWEFQLITEHELGIKYK
jgi:hypothetical protein